ncbi:MAG TPA: hypothetical protein VFZ47_01235 [Chitinophagaceae bacterium]
MRKLLVAASMLVMLAFNATQAQKTLTLNPEKPRQGSTLTIHYNPSGTPMFGIEHFSAYAYTLHTTPFSVVQEIPLGKTGNQYVGKIDIDDSARAVFFKFAKDDLADHNNDRGYYTLIYGNDGDPVPGANLAAGKMLSFTPHQMGLKRNAQAGIELMKAGFESNPSDKEKYRDDYLNYLSISTDPGAKTDLRKMADAMVSNPNATERDLKMIELAAKESKTGLTTEKKGF